MTTAPKLIQPIQQPFDIEIRLPGSKSIALREMLIAALTQGSSQLTGVPICDDVDAMTDALRRLGVKVETDPSGRTLVDPSHMDWSSDVVLDARMSGVSLRLLCALAGLRAGTTHLIGHRSLAARPNNDLLNALVDLGCEVESNGGKLPIKIKGPIQFNKVRLNVGTSSQYLSALLLIAPGLEQGLTIFLDGKLPSASYVGLTLASMLNHGVEVQDSQDQFKIQPTPYATGEFLVEGDASAMSYHAALATLHRSKVQVSNLGTRSLQGDVMFLKVCEQLGATVSQTLDTTVIEGTELLQPLTEVDMFQMPDAATTLMGIAPYLPGPIRITGLDTLPKKECDRIACPARELTKAGIEVEYGNDYLSIKPGKPKATTFSTYDDHRMAMSFGVLATATSGCAIENPECVGKTYPQFWDDLEQMY